MFDNNKLLSKLFQRRCTACVRNVCRRVIVSFVQLLAVAPPHGSASLLPLAPDIPDTDRRLQLPLHRVSCDITARS